MRNETHEETLAETTGTAARVVSRAPAKAWLAALLGFAFSPLGYYYAGLSFHFATVIGLGLDVMSVLVLSLSTLKLAWPMMIILPLAIAVMAALVNGVVAGLIARGTRPTRAAHGFGAYALFIVVNVGISVGWSLAVDAMGWRAGKTYSMASGSMEPAVLPGDRLWVDTHTLSERAPEPGELIAFHPPNDAEMIYVKRVYARGGETLAWRGDEIAIDGNTPPAVLLAGDAAKRALRGVEAPPDEALAYMERRGARSYVVVRLKATARPEYGARWPAPDQPLKLAADELFVLGDFRDKSQDSRHFGIVKRAQVVGLVRGVLIGVRGGSLAIERILAPLGARDGAEI